MLEALALTAALSTADAEVRRSDAFACWCEVCRFPPPPMDLANEHLEWLETCKRVAPEINPGIDELIAEQQDVIETYRLVRCVVARPYSPDDWDRLRRVRELIGDEDYFAGRLPPPVTCQRR